MADDLSILLTIEAVDKASAILGKIGDIVSSVSERMKASSARAKMSAEELQAVQDKAAASATAQARAIEIQTKAQETLRVDTDSLARAQEAYAAAQASATGATKAQADALEIATAKQIESLDALRAAEEETTTRTTELTASQAALDERLITSKEIGMGMAVAGGAVALAVADIGIHAVKAAADFQSSMLRMYTSAGESQGEIKDLSAKVLQLSVDTATGTTEMAKGLYFVESAGFHADAAITVMRAAAEGAKAENADLAEVSNALTTALKDFGYSANDATTVMSKMVVAVGQGKMTMQQFSSSLSTVLPTAKSAKISFDQIAAAIATMTAQGVTAEQATTDLNHMILKLQSPTIDMTKYMAQLGINSQDLADVMSKKGLTGVIDVLDQAIINHTQNNRVLVNAYNQSKVAAQDVNAMLAAMTPTLRNLSMEVMNGKITYKEYTDALKASSGPMHAQGMQFLSLLGNAQGFNQMLKSGQPAALEFTAALKKVLGDQTSLHAALTLSNGGLGQFRANVAAVAGATNDAGGHVRGWSAIQDTFNFKMSQAKEALHATEIAIGTGLLPAVTKIAGLIASILIPIATWAEHHQKLTAIILLSVGAIGALVGIVGTVIVIAGTLSTAVEALGITLAGVMTASGVGIVLLAIGAAALYVATHWKQTKEVVAEVWKWIVEQAQSVAHFFVGAWNEVVKIWDEVWSKIGGIVTHWWPLILVPVTGGLSLIVGLIIRYRKDIGDAFSAIWSWLVSVWDDTGGKLISKISHAWTVVSDSVSKEWNHIVEELSEIWGELVQLWNLTGGKLISLISSHWGQISAVIMFHVNLVWGTVKLVFGFMWSYLSSIMTSILDVFKLAWDAISGVIQIVWDIIWGIIQGAMDLIVGAIKAGWDIVAGVFKVVWDTIVAVFEVVWDTIKAVINVALDTIEGTIKVFIDLIQGHWKQAWDDIVKYLGEVLGEIWHWITSIFGDISRWLGNILNDILNMVIQVWNAIWNGIGGFLKDIWNGIKQAFTDGLNTLSSIWNDLKKIAADPVNFVIDTVYNHGIVALWNDVSGVFGGPKLGTLNPIHFAQGGLVPGVGNVDSVPAMLMPGEFVLSHAMIEKLGGMAKVVDLVGAGKNDGRNFGGGGGILGGIIDFGKGLVNDLSNLALGGLRDAAKAAFGPINAVLNTIPGSGTGFGQELIGSVKGLEDGILKFLGQKDATAPKVAGVTPQLISWINQAIGLTGVSSSWLSDLETIIMHESGGNPNAINNYDINAQNGDPSRGLMQTIMSTFLAYHQAGTSDNIYDPVANISAGINYIKGRYGNITNVPGIVSMANGGPYVGYENGTYDTGAFAQMAMLHPREAVLPAGVASAFRGGSMGTTNITFDLRQSKFSNQKDADDLIKLIERRLATFVLPAGGTRIRM